MASATRMAWVLAALLTSGIVSASEMAPIPYSPLPSGYSLSYDKNDSNDDFSVFHMAVEDRFGLLDSGFAASSDPRLRPLTRLDSSLNFTVPLIGLPMRFGDGVSSAGFWDQPARLGGLQIGTFHPAPPDVVAPPSVIALPYDVVGPADFTTSHFTDHLRSLVQFQTQSLATAGQGDFSLEAGRLRENFELRSADYGPWITSGIYRYGITAATTVDGQLAQVAGQQSFVGIGLVEGLGPLGILSARVASSHDPDSSGWLARMGYDYSHERLSIAVRSHIQSSSFQNVGDSSIAESLRQRTLASAGLDLGSMGKLSLASASQKYGDDSRRDLVAVSHAMPFGSGGIVSSAAAYSPGPFGSSTLLLTFTYPFDYVAAPKRKVDSAVNSALDRTIVDAFGQTRLPATGRLLADRLNQD